MDMATMKRLPTTTRVYWFAHSLGVGVLLTAAICTAIIFFRWPVPLTPIIAVAVTILIIDLLLIPMRQRWYRYAVTPDHCRIEHGRFMHTTTSLSSHQILQTEVSQGPLLRMLGLAEVRFVLVTGGVELAPVAAEEAERIRATILSAPHCEER